MLFGEFYHMTMLKQLLSVLLSARNGLTAAVGTSTVALASRMLGWPKVRKTRHVVKGSSACCEMKFCISSLCLVDCLTIFISPTTTITHLYDQQGFNLITLHSETSIILLWTAESDRHAGTL